MIQSCSLDGLPTCVLLFRWANRFIDNCQHFLLLRIPVSSQVAFLLLGTTSVCLISLYAIVRAISLMWGSLFFSF